VVFDDSPAQPINLQHRTFRVDAYKCSVSDDFKSYLVYKPDGGIWVPLQVITWNWRGAGEAVTMLKYKDTVPGTATTPTTSNATEPPQWDDRADHRLENPIWKWY
jgi:hypothetical protein